jgi:formate dehydrogenase subunit gamma
LFFVLMFTGAVLYVGQLSALVGRRALMREIHVYAGLALPVPLVLALFGRRAAPLRRDLGALNRWIPDDYRWVRSLGRDKAARLGKFNPGQKLNAVFLGGAAVVMLATGSILKWFSAFPVSWRTGATFAHDWFAFGIWLAVSGHVWLAFSDSDALRGIVRGTVPARWAKHKRPRWYEEVAAAARDEETRGGAAEPAG